MRIIPVALFVILFLIIGIPVLGVEWLIGKISKKTMDYSSVSLFIKGIKQNNSSSSGSDSSDDTDKTDGTESVNGTNSTDKTDSTGDNDSTEGTDAV